MIYVDLVPVILAVFALIQLNKIRDNSLEIIMCKALAVLFIICQTTWIHSYLNDFSLVTSLVDNLWTVFNSITMLLVIRIARIKRNQHATVQS